MPIYEVTKQNGQVVEVEGPSGIGRRELASLVRQKDIKERARIRDAEEVTLGERAGDFFPALGRGAVNTGELGALGLATLLPEEYEDKARDFIRSSAETLRPEREPGLEDDTLTKVVEGLGSIGPYLAAGMVGGPVAGFAGAAGLGAAAGTGDASERARAAGATEEQRNQAAMSGSLIGATQALPINRILKLTQALPNGIKGKAVKAIRGGSYEGAQEAVYEYLQNVTERKIYNPELESLMEGVLESGGIGAAVGAIVSVLIPSRGRVSSSEDAPDIESELSDTPIDDAPMDDAPLQPSAFDPMSDMTPPPLTKGRARPSQMNMPQRPVEIDDLDSLLDRLDSLELNEPRSARPSQMNMPQRPVDDSILDAALAEIENVRQPTGQLALPQPSQRDMDINANVNKLIEQARSDQESKPVLSGMDINAQKDQADLFTESLTDEQVDTFLAELLKDSDGQRDLFPRELQDAKAAPKAEPQTKLPTQAVQGELPVTTDQTPAPVQGRMLGKKGQPLGRVQDKFRGAKAKAPVVPQAKSEATPAATPVVVNDEMLNALSVPKNAPVRARVKGKDLNKPIEKAFVKRELQAFASKSGDNRTKLLTTKFFDDKSEFGSNVGLFGVDESGNAVPNRKVARDAAVKAAAQIAAKKKAPKAAKSAAPKAPVSKKKVTETANVESPVKLDTGTDGDGAKGTSGSVTQQRRRAIPTTERTAPAAGQTGRPSVASTRSDVPDTRSRKRTKSAPLAPKPKVKVAKPVDPEDKVAAVVADKKIKDVKQVQASKKGSVKDVNVIKTYYSKFEPDVAARRLAFDASELGYTSNETANRIKEEGSPRVSKELEGTSKQRAKLAVKFIEKSGTESQKKALAKAQKEVDVLVEANKGQAEQRQSFDDRVAARKAMEQRQVEERQRRSESEEAQENRRERQAAKKQQKIIDDAVDLTAEETGALSDAESDLAAFGLSESDFNMLAHEGLLELAAPMDSTAATALRSGDVQEALTIMSNRETGALSRIAKLFSGLVDDLKIEFVDYLGKKDGVLIKGQYRVSANTVYLLEDEPITNHGVLHEIAHALTHKTLKSKANPTTKKITKLYKQAKAELPASYATSTIHEFVAEYFGNSNFRRELSFMFPRDSQRKSIFQRLTDAIKRLFGNIATRGDLNDTMEQLLAPSATAATSKVYNLITDNERVLKIINQDVTTTKEEGMAAIKRLNNKALPSMLGSLQLSLVVDTAKDAFKSAIPIQNTISEYEGRLYGDQQAIAVTAAKDLQEWGQENTEALTDLKQILLDGTLAQIDFRKAKNEYRGEQRAAYEKLEPIWNSLKDNGGQLEYKKVRSNYDRMYKDLLSQLEVALGAIDPETGTKIYSELYEHFKNNALEGYFPLQRRGKYLLSYTFTDAEGKARDAFEMFPNATERDSRVAFLKENLLEPEQIPLIRTPTKLTDYLTGDKIPYSFVGKSLSLINRLGNTPEVEVIKEELIRTAIEAAPQRTVLNALKKRTGKAGYNDDVVNVYGSSLTDLARKINSMKMRDELSRTEAELDAEMKIIAAENNSPENERKLIIGEELKNRIALARNPITGTVTDVANIAKTVAYGYTLGVNASSALIDTFSLPMVIAPHLNAKFDRGIVNTNKILLKAVKDVMSTPMKTTVESYTTKGLSDKEIEESGLEKRDVREKRAWYSLANMDLSGNDRNSRELRPLVDAMRNYGQIHQTAWSQDSGEMTGETSRPWLSLLNNAMGSLMQGSERVRREATILASYRMRLEDQRKAGDKVDYEKAAREAITDSQMVNGAMSTLSNTRFGQKPLMSMAFMYKSYGTRMMYLQLKMFKAALGGETPEAREAARNHIFNVYLASVAFAGVRGIPMIGIFAFMWDMILTDDDEDDFDNMLRKKIGVGLSTGLVNTFAGVNVADRISLTDMLYRSNRNYDQTPSELYATLALGPVWGVVSRVPRAFSAWERNDYARVAESGLPPVLSNPLKAIRYGLSGAKTTSGDMITNDFGGLSLAGQFLGFAPTSVTESQRFTSNQKRIETERAQDRSMILKRAWLAYRMGDGVGYSDEIKEAIEFNRSLPANSKFRIDIGKDGTFDRSFRSRMKAVEERVMGIRYKDKDQAQMAKDALEI